MNNPPMGVYMDSSTEGITVINEEENDHRYHITITKNECIRLTG